jgi:hypothetical protein
MPRTARASQGGYCYHVLNRGNGRAEVFHKDGDYDAFVRLLADAHERLPPFLHEGPVPRPKSWLAYVQEPLTAAELAHVRHSVVRGTPFGEPSWMQRAAERLGLEASLRLRGRPSKAEK